MAYSDRRPLFNFSGTLKTGITAVTNTITSDAFTTLPTIYNSETYLPLVIADDSAGVAEVVYVTNHAAASNAVTVARAREGTVAAAWSAGVVIRCAPTVPDVQRVMGQAFVSPNVALPGPAGTVVSVPLVATGASLVGGMTFSNTSGSPGLVVPTDGYYEARCNAWLLSPTRASGARVMVRKNGATTTLLDFRPTKFTANEFDVNQFHSGLIWLNANDRVHLAATLVWFDNNSATISLYGNGGPTGSYLELIKV